MDLFWLAVVDHHFFLFVAAATGVTATATAAGVDGRGFSAFVVVGYDEVRS